MIRLFTFFVSALVASFAFAQTPVPPPLYPEKKPNFSCRITQYMEECRTTWDGRTECRPTHNVSPTPVFVDFFSGTRGELIIETVVDNKRRELFRSYQPMTCDFAQYRCVSSDRNLVMTINTIPNSAFQSNDFLIRQRQPTERDLFRVLASADIFCAVPSTQN